MKKINHVVDRDMEGNYLDTLTIDNYLIDKLNEVIDYINEKDKLE